MTTGHESEENVRVWKDSLLGTFGAKTNELGDAEVIINISNAISTVEVIETLSVALEKYFKNHIPDPNVAYKLDIIGGAAGDLLEYLTDEGDFT
jgi:hypothetical protein